MENLLQIYYRILLQIYYRSTNMNYFIYILHKRVKGLDLGAEPPRIKLC